MKKECTLLLSLLHHAKCRTTLFVLTLGVGGGSVEGKRKGLPRGSRPFHQHIPHPSSSSFTAFHQVYLSKRYNGMKGTGEARRVGGKGEGAKNYPPSEIYLIPILDFTNIGIRVV